MLQQEKRRIREERILSLLDELTYAKREHIQVIEKLGSDRNANRILREMERDKSISSVRMEYKVYYLSGKGKQRKGSNKGELKRSHIHHILMRNDLYIKLDMPRTWKKEQPVNLGEIKLIPDALYRKGQEYFFVEIDNSQTMKTNIDKIKKYKLISDALQKQTKQTPTLIWYSLSDVRKKKLREACEKSGVKHIIY